MELNKALVIKNSVETILVLIEKKADESEKEKSE